MKLSHESVRQRAALLQQIRSFFLAEDFLEVDTPALAPSVIPEPTIDIFSTRADSTFGASKELYLLPSPERWLKRLICNGETRIYQLSHSYRNNEPPSGLHACEFMMLEWYAADSDYMAELSRTQRLLRRIAGTSSNFTICDEILEDEPVIFTIDEAFDSFAHIDLNRCASVTDFRRRLDELDIHYEESDSWADLFHRILVEFVEPGIRTVPVAVLTDYPSAVNCLAKVKTGTLRRERWELYMKGVEIANCYSEETNVEALHKLVDEERRAMNDHAVAVDEEIATVHAQSPGSYSGVALGFDRLCMTMYGYSRIEEVAYFIEELYE